MAWDPGRPIGWISKTRVEILTVPFFTKSFREAEDFKADILFDESILSMSYFVILSVIIKLACVRVLIMKTISGRSL